MLHEHSLIPRFPVVIHLDAMLDASSIAAIASHAKWNVDGSVKDVAWFVIDDPHHSHAIAAPLPFRSSIVISFEA